MRSSGAGKRSGGRNSSIGSQSGSGAAAAATQPSSSKSNGKNAATPGPPPGFENGPSQRRRSSHTTAAGGVPPAGQNVWTANIGTWNNSMSTAPAPSGKSTSSRNSNNRNSYGGVVRTGAVGQHSHTPHINGHGNANNSNNNISYSSATKFAHATFKGNKANKPLKIDTSQPLTQSKASLELQGLDPVWANTVRNQFLKEEMQNVVNTMIDSKSSRWNEKTKRLVGAYQYIEKDDTECSKLHYMKGFQPLDIAEHKVNLLIRRQHVSNSASTKSSHGKNSLK